jgi:hypothetical protein
MLRKFNDLPNRGFIIDNGMIKFMVCPKILKNKKSIRIFLYNNKKEYSKIQVFHDNLIDVDNLILKTRPDLIHSLDAKLLHLTNLNFQKEQQRVFLDL